MTLLAKTKFEKSVTIIKNSKNLLWCKISKYILDTKKDLLLCGTYIPPEKSTYFEKEIFDELENDIALFSLKGHIMILGDLNARTGKLDDFVSKNGKHFINDTSEHSLKTKTRQNFDNQINNHGKQLINVCKSCDLRILNGRTKGDSLGRPTYHGRNGTSVVDYIICDQDLFQNIEYFVVKPPSYLSDHSQIITWVGIGKPIDEPNLNSCHIEMTKLPNQFIWDDQLKNIFRQTLKSAEVQIKIDAFINSDFNNDLNGITNCVTKFQDILLETSKKSLKIKKIQPRRKINNVAKKQ